MNEDWQAIRVMGFWYWLWCKTGGYRWFMRLAHRFHWCYMAPKPQIQPDRLRFVCDWCGASRNEYIGMPAITASSGSLRKEGGP